MFPHLRPSGVLAIITRNHRGEPASSLLGLHSHALWIEIQSLKFHRHNVGNCQAVLASDSGPESQRAGSEALGVYCLRAGSVPKIDSELLLHADNVSVDVTHHSVPLRAFKVGFDNVVR